MSHGSDCKFEYCIYSIPLLDKLALNNKTCKNPVNIEQIKKAISFARKYHATQRRKTGEPYYSHPLEVASLAADFFLDTDMIITAILHDTLEDTALTFKDISRHFSPKIADHVMDLTRVKPTGKISSCELCIILFNENKKKLLLIKLLDRLHNMRTLRAQSIKSQRKNLYETITIFVSVAIYLNAPAVEKELTDLSILYSEQLVGFENEQPPK